MGSDWYDIESPVRTVDVDGFWIDRLPVSHRDFLAYVTATQAPWVPDWPEGLLKIRDAALACGREPEIIRRLWRTANVAPSSILHFGWTNASERKERHHRYVLADGGEFHARRHLDSILWPDRRVRLTRREWPAALEPWRERIVERAAREAVAA